MAARNAEANPAPRRVDQLVRVPSVYSHNRRVVTRQEIDGRIVFVVNQPSLRDAANGARPEDQLAATGKLGDPLALIYGYGPHAGMVFFRRVDSIAPGSAYGALVLGILWGMGPVHAFDRIQYTDGQDLDSDITYEHYRGNPADANFNTIDSEIAGVEPAYTDTLVATDDETGLQYAAAYTVLRIPARLWTQGIPEFQAWISGHPVYDPRDGTQTFGNFGSYKYSANAALVHADLYTHPLRGMGRTLDWSTVEVPATNCEGARSRQIHTRFESVQRAASLLDVAGDYASTTIVADGNSAYMLELKNETPIATLTRDDTIGGFSVSQRGGQETPDVVEVEYSADDPSEPYRRVTRTVRARRAGLGSSANPYVTETVSMPGCTDEDQAYQYSVRRLNMLRSDVEVAWRAPDSAFAYTRGDVVQVTDGNGLTNFRVRLSEINFEQPGRYRIRAVEDSAAMYAADPAPDPPSVPPDWNDISPVQPQPPVNVSIPVTAFYFPTEGARQIYVAQLQWDATDWVYTQGYRLRFFETVSGLNLIDRTESHVQGKNYSFISPALDKSKGYTLSVTTIGPYGDGAAVTDQVTTPDYAVELQPPKNVQSEQDGQEVRITWERPDVSYSPPVSTANDVDYYVVRRGLQSQTVADWAVMTPISENVTDLYALDLKAPAGDWRYFVRAVSWTGDLSDQAGTVDVTVLGVSDFNYIPVGHFPSWSEGTQVFPTASGYFADLFYLNRGIPFNVYVQRGATRDGKPNGFYSAHLVREVGDTSELSITASYAFESSQVYGLRNKRVTIDVWVFTSPNFSIGLFPPQLILRTSINREGNIDELSTGIWEQQTLLMDGNDLPLIGPGLNQWTRMTASFPDPIPDDAMGMIVGVRWFPAAGASVGDSLSIAEMQLFEGDYYFSLSSDPKRQAPLYDAVSATEINSVILRQLRYDENTGQAAQLAHVMRTTPTESGSSAPFKYDARL